MKEMKKLGTTLNTKVKKLSLSKILIINADKYVMLLPFFILFIVFTVLPVISSMFLSMTSFNLLELPKYVGLENYIKLFLEDEIFIKAVTNTIVFAVITGPLSYIACLFIAWLINELSPVFRALLTLLFYAPTLSGNLYIIWKLIFSGDMYGWANGILMSTGLINEPIQWLSDPRYNFTIIIVVQLWLSLGTGFLAFIAGLQSVDRTLYEAAAIDGIKSRFQELFYVTIPSMGPQLLFAAILQISSSFAVGRICIDLAGMPSTDYSAHTMITHAIDYGTIRYEMGYASAIATVLFLVMLFMNRIIHKILAKYI